MLLHLIELEFMLLLSVLIFSPVLPPSLRVAALASACLRRLLLLSGQPGREGLPSEPELVAVELLLAAAAAASLASLVFTLFA